MILLWIALQVFFAGYTKGFLTVTSTRRDGSYLHHRRVLMHAKGVYTDDKEIKSYDSFGFSPQLRVGGFTVPTHVIFGTNAMEHGVNLLEEIGSEALVVHGWNAARLDTLLWELEPRGFRLDFLSIGSLTPAIEDVAEIVKTLERGKMRVVIAVGGGNIIDAVKLAATVMAHNVTGVSIVSPNTPVIMCSIPLLPAGGAEISSYSAIRSYNIDAREHRQKKKLTFKQYIPTISPDLCIVHPVSLYRASMADVNEKILNLMATCFEIIIDGDAGYMSELLVQDALRVLIIILDKAISAHEERFIDRENHFSEYFDFTVNDVDPNDPDDPGGHHRQTQFFRRYGHSFDEGTIVDICRLSVSVNSAKVGGSATITPMQFLADCLVATDLDMTMTDGNQYSSTYASFIARIFPRYALALLDWIEDGAKESRRESPEKSYARVSMNKLAEILGASKFLVIENDGNCEGTGEREENDCWAFRCQMIKLMQIVDRITDRSDRVGPEPMEISLSDMSIEQNGEQSDRERYEISERDAYELSMKMGAICGKDCIGSRIDPLIIRKVLNEILHVPP